MIDRRSLITAVRVELDEHHQQCREEHTAIGARVADRLGLLEGAVAPAGERDASAAARGDASTSSTSDASDGAGGHVAEDLSDTSSAAARDASSLEERRKPAARRPREAIDLYPGPTTLGIDVSAYQPDVDWARVARSEPTFKGQRQGPVRYAIVRTSDGVQTRRSCAPDPWAVRHLVGAHEAGLLVAGYHYVRGYHPAAAQVELILDVVRTAGVPIGWIALDLEGRPDDPTTPDTDESHGAWWTPPGVKDELPTAIVLSCLDSMASKLEAAGLRVLIYTGQSWHWYVAQRGLQLSAVLVRLPLWTPYYTTSSKPRLPVDRRGGPAPWPSWTIWQYASTGIVPGVPGGVDLNRFRGDEAAVRAWWSGGQAP